MEPRRLRAPRRAALASVGIGLLAAAIGCASPGAPPPPQPKPMDREPYVIGVLDQLRITVWKNAELDVTVPVRSDGKISVPLLDDVQAEGLTPEELKEVITRSLSEYISSPQVTVIVSAMNSRTISVLGAVARNGAVPVAKDMRVSDAIAAAGGFTIFAHKNDVKILRRNGDGFIEYRFSFGDFVAGKARDKNIVLVPGDTVIVPD
jgi:polysaccharide biosynthesis/export protein